MIAFLLALTLLAPPPAPDPGVARVVAGEQQIELEFAPADGPRQLVELDPWQADGDAGRVAMEVAAGAATAAINRTDADGRDRAYRRFVLRAGGENLGRPRWVGAFASATNAADLTWPESIKGVTVPMDVADLVELGVRHIHTNVRLGPSFLAEGEAPPAYRIEESGFTFHLDPAAVADMDEDYKELSDAGINVVVVLLNPFMDGPLGEALNVPTADRAGHYTAFRIDNPESAARLTGFVRFLVERYTAEGFPHGRVGGLIVGNEIDTHWTWHNMGPASLEQVATHYAKELRLAHLAARRAHADFPVFTSLTHSWTWPNSLDETRNLPAKDLLDRLVELGHEGGDFDWHLAYHPYPSNLFEPAFWNDRPAVFAFDTPQITFKNIEVLAEYLAQDHMLVNGEPRRLILSEQGFHAADTPDGERLQAAALALAYQKVERIDAIDSLILHRHLDHPDEGGLRLGLLALEREPMEDPANWRRRPAWELYRHAGTPEFADAARPYLEWIGREAVAAATPPEGPIPVTSGADLTQAEDVVFDFARQAADAEVEHELAWDRRLVDLPDGGVRDALLLHPKGEGNPPAEAHYDLTLPEGDLELRVTTGKLDSGGDGYALTVLAGGEPILRRRQPGQAMQDLAAALPPRPDGSLRLTFCVERLGDADYDSALLIHPRVVRPAEEVAP